MAPNVFGQALRINPLLVIFALLLGGQIAGFIGAFIALPIAAIVRETVVYLRRHLRFQRWDLPAAPPPPPPQDALPGVRRARAADARRVPRVRDRARRPRRRAASASGRADVSARRRVSKRYGDREALQRRLVRASPRASGIAIIGPNGAGKTTLLQILAGALPPDAGDGVAPERRRLGAAAAGALLEAVGGARTCGCSRGWRRSPDVDAGCRRMLELTGLARPRGDETGKLSGGNRQRREHRDRPARRPAGAAARRAVGVAGPAPARAAVGVHRRRSRHDASSTRRTTSARPSATPTACSCWPTASCCSPAPRAARGAVGGRRRRRPRGRVRRASCTSAATERALAPAQGPADPAPLAAAGRAAGDLPGRRSRVLIGPRSPAGRRSRASRSPTSCRGRARRSSSAAARSTRATYADRLFETIDPIRVTTREEAIAEGAQRRGAGRAGDPGDATERLQRTLGLGGGEPPTVEVFYNAEDPVKRRYVESTIDSRAGRRQRRALGRGAARSRRSTSTLIVSGGKLSLPLVGDVDILGLRNARDDHRRRGRRAAAGRAASAWRSSRSAASPRLAADNLDVSKPILGLDRLAGERQADRRRRAPDAARRVRGGGRGDGLADVRDAAAGRRAAGAGARGAACSGGSCAGSSRAPRC